VALFAVYHMGDAEAFSDYTEGCDYSKDGEEGMNFAGLMADDFSLLYICIVISVDCRSLTSRSDIVLPVHSCKYLCKLSSLDIPESNT
jgi:hypothetical protein